MQRLALVLSTAFAILLPFVFFTYLFIPPERPFGFDELGIVRRLAMSGIFLLLGILFSQVYKGLSIEPRLSAKEIIHHVFSRELARSLLASPVLFLANYLITQQITDVITGNLLAFQTGFFCDVVLAKRREKAGE